MLSTGDETLSEQERAAKITTDMLLQITSVSFDRAAAYTSLVTVGGYAGAFSIWAFVSNELPRLASASVALLLGFSLLIFVLYEIYKMVSITRQLLPLSGLLNPPKQPTEFLRAFENFERKRKLKSATRGQIWTWIIAMILSIGSALSAVGILFYNMLAIILEWPLWPH
ncbi:hypothetical protein [Devosia geojensis]|nr:hypothetical protein [Devosia geojensis]